MTTIFILFLYLAYYSVQAIAELCDVLNTHFAPRGRTTRDRSRLTHAEWPMIQPMNTTPRFPCPVCTDCDHDIRSTILDLGANIMENLKAANEALLDAVEAEGEGSPEFINAINEFMTVRQQVDAVLEVLPQLQDVKAANAA